jgi:hypothetical protein
MGYIKRTIIAIDQLINVVLCNGEPDETMSSNSYRMSVRGGRWGFMCKVIDAIASPWEKDHCRLSFESERDRMHLPPEFRPVAPPNLG